MVIKELIMEGFLENTVYMFNVTTVFPRLSFLHHSVPQELIRCSET